MSRILPFLTSSAVHGSVVLLLGLGGWSLSWEPARTSVAAPKPVPLTLDVDREPRETTDFHRADPPLTPLPVEDVELDVELEVEMPELDVLPPILPIPDRPLPRLDRPMHTSVRVAGEAPVPVPEVESETAPIDLYNPPPVYPATPRRRGQEGVVVADLSVGKDGAVGEVAIVVCSGSSLFEAAVRKAVGSWRYRPATLGGLPIETVHRVRFVFRLG